jgi:uncharacterized protein (TIGR02266 family)
LLIDRSFSQLLSEDPASPDPSDRRAERRVPLEVDVALSMEGALSTLVSGNVSRGGLLVWTYRALPPGTRASVTFRLPTGTVVATVVVRWMGEGRAGRVPCMGLQFVEVPSIDLQTLSRFCDCELARATSRKE